MNAQGTYLTSTARNHARKNGLHEGTVIGNFNGEFWAVFASHQVNSWISSLQTLVHLEMLSGKQILKLNSKVHTFLM